MKKIIAALILVLNLPLMGMEAPDNPDLARLVGKHPNICKDLTHGKHVVGRCKEEPTIAVDFAAAIVNEDVEKVKGLASFCFTMSETYPPKELQAAALLAVQTNKVKSLKALFQSGVRLDENTQHSALTYFFGLVLNADQKAHMLQPLFETLEGNNHSITTPLMEYGPHAKEACLPFRKIIERAKKYEEDEERCCNLWQLPYEAARNSYLCNDLRNTGAFFNLIITQHAQQMAKKAAEKQKNEHHT